MGPARFHRARNEGHRPADDTAQTRTHWAGHPVASSARLIDALGLFAILMSEIASTLQIITRRPPIIGTWEMPAGLPGETSDTQQQETETAVPSSQPTQALMVSSTRSVRPSNHEGVLTARAMPTKSFLAPCREFRLAQHRDHQLTVPLVSTNVGTQESPRSLSGLEATIPRKAHHRSWIPIFIGMSGAKPAPNPAPL